MLNPSPPPTSPPPPTPAPDPPQTLKVRRNGVEGRQVEFGGMEIADEGMNPVLENALDDTVPLVFWKGKQHPSQGFRKLPGLVDGTVWTKQEVQVIGSSALRPSTRRCAFAQDKARQGKDKDKDKTRQDKTRQDKTRQDSHKINARRTASTVVLGGGCCLVLSCVVLCCLVVLSCLVMSCVVLPYLVMSYLVMSCLVMSCLVLSCLILSCLVMSCLALSCHVFSCHVFSCLVVFCLVLSRLVLCCGVLSRLLLVGLWNYRARRVTHSSELLIAAVPKGHLFGASDSNDFWTGRPSGRE